MRRILSLLVSVVMVMVLIGYSHAASATADVTVDCLTTLQVTEASPLTFDLVKSRPGSATNQYVLAATFPGIFTMKPGYSEPTNTNKGCFTVIGDPGRQILVSSSIPDTFTLTGSTGSIGIYPASGTNYIRAHVSGVSCNADGSTHTLSSNIFTLDPSSGHLYFSWYPTNNQGDPLIPWSNSRWMFSNFVPGAYSGSLTITVDYL